MIQQWLAKKKEDKRKGHKFEYFKNEESLFSKMKGFFIHKIFSVFFW